MLKKVGFFRLLPRSLRDLHGMLPPLKAHYGRLPEVLMQAADLMDRDVKLRRSILGATLYPMILAVLVVGAIIVVVTFIVPKLLEQFAGQSARLPWPTQVL